ncbi:hypothetical protein [Mycolicibacter minnesotensis]
MVDPVEPYGREDLNTAVEHLAAMGAALADLQEPLDAVGEVIAAVQATDNIRDPMRDVLVYPDVEDARVAAHMLSDALESFEAVSAQLTAALSQLESDLNESAQAFDDNEADVRDEYERDAQVSVRWEDVPLDNLPSESHYDRMSQSEKFVARVAKDPRERHVCSRCERHFQSRRWLGPLCNDCHQKGNAK